MADCTGPLRGLKVIEFAGIGPGPYAAMLLCDMGAEVVRIDRKGGREGSKFDTTRRGRRSLALDLKQGAGAAAALRLIAGADALIEGFRPGVMERLGLGPQECLAANKRLVYGRMTGWGQAGPLAGAAGHDINYIALSGALAAIGPAGGGPVPPLNLVGDFGGGALFLAFGVACALLEAAKSGHGQVVDAAMTDGAASLMTAFYGLAAAGIWRLERGMNHLDSGAHFYNVYETADGKHVAIGAIESQFYALLREKLGIVDPAFDAHMTREAWPGLKTKLEAIFKTKTREDWCALLEGTDACFAPVLNMAEAPGHPHNVARETFIEIEGVVQPNVAPRFSRTPGHVQGPPVKIGAHTEEVLRDWGFAAPEIAQLRAAGAI
jgi:alpha-methylacyl-CoA racemase